MVSRERNVAVGGRARDRGNLRSGRTARSKDLILQAALATMTEVGVRKMTIEAVAATAGVAKTTIYRWWRSKGLLVLDAFDHGFAVLESAKSPDTGSLKGDLSELMRQVIESRGSVAERLGPQIIAEAQSDQELAAAIYSRIVAPYRILHQSIFEAAAARGEISRSFDTELLFDALYGAYFHRLLLHHGKIDTAFFESLVDLLATGATGLHVVSEPRRTNRR